jgi:hypothetical protein
MSKKYVLFLVLLSSTAWGGFTVDYFEYKQVEESIIFSNDNNSSHRVNMLTVGESVYL